MDKNLYIVLCLAIFISILIIVFFCGRMLKHKTTKNNYKEKVVDTVTSKDSNELAIDLANVDIMLRNELGDELTLTQVNNEFLANDKKYIETKIPSVLDSGADLIKVGLPIEAQVKTVKEIAKNAKNGLFTATASPDMLSRFKDGTVSTMVRPKGSKGIRVNAGFKEVPIESLTTINPAVAIATGMQAMALISGQYYMTQISKQLMETNAYLSELKDYHNDEKIGILINTRKRLLELSNHVNSDNTDINELKAMYGKVGDVYEEYKIRFDKCFSELMELDPVEWKSKARVAKYNSLLEKIKLPFLMASESDKLCIQARIAELSARKKNDVDDIMIPELLNDLKYAINNSFNNMLLKEQYSLTTQMLEKADEVIIGTKPIKPSEKRKAKLLESIAEDVDGFQNKMNQSYNLALYQNALEDNGNERTLLLMPDDNNSTLRAFIEIDQSN